MLLYNVSVVYPGSITDYRERWCQGGNSRRHKTERIIMVLCCKIRALLAVAPSEACPGIVNIAPKCMNG